MEHIFVWTPRDVIGIFVIGAIVFAYLAFAAYDAVKQLLCKHGEVGETMACDAVCRKCGKNLGFIGTWREKQGVRNNSVREDS